MAEEKTPNLGFYLAWLGRLLWRFAVVYVVVVLVMALLDWTHTWQAYIAGALIIGTSVTWTIEVAYKRGLLGDEDG